VIRKQLAVFWKWYKVEMWILRPRVLQKIYITVYMMGLLVLMSDGEAAE